MLIHYDRECIAQAERIAMSPTATRESLNPFVNDFYWKSLGKNYPNNRVLSEDAYLYIKELQKGLPKKIRR